jgi:hypothetical protein
MRTVNRSLAAPHRCPRCHAIRTWSRPARFYRRVYCADCDVRWWPGWRWSREPGR